MIEYVHGIAYRLVPVTEEDAAVLRAVDLAWARIQQADERVPPIVAELTPGRHSSCTSPGWAPGQTALIAVNLMPDGRKLTGAALMGWLLHQAAHSQALPTAASEGRWHSYSYAKAAESLGLDVQSGPNGFSVTTLRKDAATSYRIEIAALDKVLKAWTPTPQVKAERTSRNGVAATCQCSPARKIRVSEKTFDLGEILCSICRKPFVST